MLVHFPNNLFSIGNLLESSFPLLADQAECGPIRYILCQTGYGKTDKTELQA